MAVALVSGHGGSGTTTSVTITAAAAGNTLVLFCSSFRGAGARTISSIACTNVTWNKLAAQTGAALNIEIWYGVVAGGSSGTTITLTMSGTSSTLAARVEEFSGVLTASPLDGTGVVNNGLNSGPSTSAYSTTRPNELILACVGLGNGTAPTVEPGGWQAVTFVANSTVDCIQGNYIAGGTLGAQSAAWTLGGNATWGTVLGALRSASPVVVPGLTPLIISGAAPTRVVVQEYIPGVGALHITGKVPTLPYIVPKSALTVSGKVPILASNRVVPKTALAITGLSSTLVDRRIVPVVDLTVSGYAPTVVASSGTTLSIPAGSIAVTGLTPALKVNYALPAPATLSITGKAPAYRPVVPTGAISVSGKAPYLVSSVPKTVISVGTLGPALTQGIAIPSGALSVTGLAPNLSLGLVVGSTSLSVTGTSVALAESNLVPAAALSVAGYVPSVNVSANRTLDVPKTSLVMSGYPPVLELVLAVPSVALAFSAQPVTTAIGYSVSSTSLGIGTYAPSLGTSVVLAIPSGSVVILGESAALSLMALVPYGLLTVTGYLPVVRNLSSRTGGKVSAYDQVVDRATMTDTGIGAVRTSDSPISHVGADVELGG